jgi:hypothetical protein
VEGDGACFDEVSLGFLGEFVVVSIGVSDVVVGVVEILGELRERLEDEEPVMCGWRAI